MGNYESVGKYKIKTKDDCDSRYSSNFYPNTKIEIIKAYNGFEKGYLLIIPTKRELYMSNLNLMKEVFEKITTAQKEKDILLKVNEYLYEELNKSVEVYFSFPERSNFISINDYIDGIDLYYLKCSDIKRIAIKLNEIIKYIKQNNFPIPFFSPEHFFFDKTTLTKIKYIYIYPYLQYFDPKGYDFYSRISSIIPKKVKSFFPESNYLNWNIGLFLYRILFRETPNYQIKIKNGIIYYSIDIKDYRISDYDESLFNLLHFLLDIEVKENNNIRDNLKQKEDELYNIYLSHPFFQNEINNKFEVIKYSLQKKTYILKKIKKKTISSLIKEIDKYNRLSMYDISKVLKITIEPIFLFNNSELFVIINFKKIEVYDINYKLLYKTSDNEINIKIIHRLENGFIFYLEKNIYGIYLFNKKNYIKIIIDFPVYLKDAGDDNLIEYKQYFITNNNKLIIKKKTNDYHYNMFLVYDFNGLIIGTNKKFQLETILSFKLFENPDMIVENVKSNELISIIDEYIYFYENEIYNLKFKLYIGKKNGKIKKAGDEIFLIGFTNYFYVLKRHKFLFTFCCKSGFWDLEYGILLNNNLLLCLIYQNYHYYSSYEHLKYGVEIIDHPNGKYPKDHNEDYYYRLILYQIDDYSAIKQNINVENKEFIQYYYLKDNIIRKINKKGKYKYYILVEE